MWEITLSFCYTSRHRENPFFVCFALSLYRISLYIFFLLVSHQLYLYNLWWETAHLSFTDSCYNEANYHETTILNLKKRQWGEGRGKEIGWRIIKFNGKKSINRPLQIVTSPMIYYVSAQQEWLFCSMFPPLVFLRFLPDLLPGLPWIAMIAWPGLPFPSSSCWVASFC